MPAGIPVPPDLIPDPDPEPLQRLLDGNPDRAQIETMIHRLSGRLPEQARREDCGRLLALLLPLDQLIPDCYAQWRPVVRDAVGFIGASLSASRLIPKLVEQLSLPGEVTLEKRLAAFIARMPVLQKLGQTIARNRHLDAEFRAELMLLEDMIRDVSPRRIQDRIRELLGGRMESYDVELEGLIHAEASVSAVMCFTWFDPVNGLREQGVFKVLKPGIPGFYREELDILRNLARHLGEHGTAYPFSAVDFNKIFDDIGRLMERELDSVMEQASLEAAGQRYRDVPGVRIPRLIPELSAPGITAMSLERGAKVTEVLVNDPRRRNLLAQRLGEALIAVPLFSPEENAVFHADPHAGNLYFNEDGDDLIIFDWAMTETLGRDERRLITMLLAAVMLRDERLIYMSLRELCGDSLSGRAACRVRAHIRRFTCSLSPLTLPGLDHVLGLLDAVFQTGVNFTTPLLIFRKVLLTLDGVLYDMDLKLPMENVLARYLMGLEEVWYRHAPGQGNPSVAVSNADLWTLWWSTSWLGLRIGIQTWARMCGARQQD